MWFVTSQKDEASALGLKLCSNTGDPAHVSMPGVHRIASLIKRWILSTHQGSFIGVAYQVGFASRDHGMPIPTVYLLPGGSRPAASLIISATMDSQFLSPKQPHNKRQ